MDVMIKESVAALFCHAIKLNDKNLDVVRPLFCRFIEEDFNSTTYQEANQLLDNVMEEEFNIDMQISIIANALHNETYTKMALLKQLNQIIVKSKLNDDDYDIFEKVKKAFFPNG